MTASKTRRLYAESLRSIAEQIISVLPSGTGIDDKWSWRVTGARNRLAFSNVFRAKNREDVLCHEYEFEVVFVVLPNNTVGWHKLTMGREHRCCGWELRTYLSDIISASVTDFVFSDLEDEDIDELLKELGVFPLSPELDVDFLEKRTKNTLSTVRFWYEQISKKIQAKKEQRHGR